MHAEKGFEEKRTYVNSPARYSPLELNYVLKGRRLNRREGSRRRTIIYFLYVLLKIMREFITLIDQCPGLY